MFIGLVQIWSYVRMENYYDLGQSGQLVLDFRFGIELS